MAVHRQQRASPSILGGAVGTPAVEKGIAAAREATRPRKMLVNVTVERSLGAVMVVMSSEETVGDLIRAAVGIYAAEKRRPYLAETDPKHFELHYSPFSLECLKEEEKLRNLESRNFFMCKKAMKSSYSKQANTNSSSFAFAWTKLLHFWL